MEIFISEEKFKVLVRCYTYNQAPFIGDALNGFSKQLTDFPYVCVVVDDASTDGERDVILSFLRNSCMSDYEVIDLDYSELILAKHKDNLNCHFAFYLLKQNLYKQKNKKKALIDPWRDVCVYEATCEGDDYWTDSHKLQIQVAVMESEGDIGLCYTKCRHYNQTNGRFDKNAWGGDAETFEDMIKANPVPTASAVFLTSLRKRYEEEIKPEEQGWMLGDYPFWLWLSKESKVKFINRESCVYRVLEHSASQRDNKERRNAFVTSVTNIQHFFADRYGQSELVSADKEQTALLMDSFSNREYQSVITHFHNIEHPGFKTILKYMISFILVKLVNRN